MQEIKDLNDKLSKKINYLKMHTTESKFNYEQPEMIYDKKTGDVKIIEKKVKKKERIIKNFDDLKREKTLLFKEVGLIDKEHNEIQPVSSEKD